MGRWKGRSRKSGDSSKPSAAATRTLEASFQHGLLVPEEHRPDTFPVHTRIPTAPVHMVRGILQRSSNKPSIVEDRGVYSVQFCLDSQHWGGRLEYLVDWQGYGPEEGYWIARDDILDPDLLTSFYENRPNQRATNSMLWSPALRSGYTVRYPPRSTLNSLTRLTLTEMCWLQPPVTNHHTHQYPLQNPAPQTPSLSGLN